MDEEKAVCQFVGKIMGLDTERMIFNPLWYDSDLTRLEHWLADNNVAFTISHMPKQDTEGLFMVLMGMEGYEDLIKIVHADRAVAFITAFCFLHGHPGLSAKDNTIEWWIQE